jgi:protein-L-isoaspartate(D-aspartate) O-methyltransferase
MDFEQARFNMVEQQIRPWEVLDPTILDLLAKVKREDFVPERYRALAFADLEIPLGHGESMLSPKLEARMVQELAVRPEDRVLEIGTGSGYMTALLASLTNHVYSLEIVPEFSAQAAQRLARHGIDNVTLEVGDGATGWSTHAPYDVIVLTGSVPVLPPAIEQQLARGGRLLAVVGDAPVMAARRVVKVDDQGTTRVDLFETCIKALRNAAQPERFVF